MECKEKYHKNVRTIYFGKKIATKMEEIYKMTLLHILHAIKIIVALRIRLEVDKDFSKENEKDSWNWTSYNFSIGSRELCHA